MEGIERELLVQHNRNATSFRQRRLQELRDLFARTTNLPEFFFVGCGVDRDTEFLAVAASASNGSLTECTEESLAAALRNYFRATTSIVASSLRMQLQWDAPVSIRVIGLPFNMIDEFNAEVYVPNLSKGAPADVHVEVVLDPGVQSCNFSVRCVYATDQVEQRSVESHLFLSREIGASRIPSLEVEFERAKVAQTLRVSKMVFSS